ncbi:MAG: hypothetical protein WBC51_04735 [Vicinamibacterales bacterium]
MRKNRQLIVMAACAILCATSIVVLRASTPVLYTTQDVYCGLYAPGWGIYGTDADPLEDVEYIEYRWNGSQWVVSWGPAVVTYAIEDGTFAWYTHGPDNYGFYYAKVTVNGQTSNEAHFYVSSSC